MGSVHLTSPVETSTVYCVLSDRGVKICITMAASTNLKLFLLISVVAASPSSPSALRLRRAPQREGTRLFTGNDAIDAGAAGAALGAAAQFLGNQILNPCRGGNRGANNAKTNNRFLNGQTLQNAGLGFLAGFAGSSLINNALGNPCGK